MVRIEREAVLCGRPKNRLSVCTLALVAAWLLGLGNWAGNARSDSATGLSILDEQVGELIAGLDDPRSSIRREALVRLARLSVSASVAIPAVTDRLQDDEPSVRAHAARTACRIGVAPDQAIPVLCDLLQPDEPQLCCLASLILGEIGSKARHALPTLRSCMKSQDPSVRLHAAEAILKIDSTDLAALRELLAGMDDDGADKRFFAANALGEAALDSGQAIFALHWALTDENTNVAITAALNLSKRFQLLSSGGANVPELAEQTRLVENLRDPLPVIRQAAAIRLGLAGPAARRAITTLLERLNDTDLAVRVHAAHALWQIDRPAGAIVPVLVNLLGVSKSNVRLAATYVLGEMGPAASDALPSLYDMFATARLRDRLLLTMAIPLIDPRDREMVGVLIGSLHEQAGDVRYMAAMALGSGPVAHQRRIEKALTVAADDRNLRVQAAAAEALSRFELRTHQARHALTAQYESNFAAAEAESATGESNVEASPPAPLASPDDASAIETSPQTLGDSIERESNDRNSSLPITEVSQSVERTQTSDRYEDPDEGLRPIREVTASIRPTTGEEPADYAAARFAGERTVYHAMGMSRPWSTIAYGWDAPAMYYKPVYFEDINLERYGIHYGLGSPFLSFGKFFATFPFLPYKMLMQPPCECHYTMGLERPNNCVPVHCFGWGTPKLSPLWWCDRGCHYCPIRAACPWTRDCRPCDIGCSPFGDPNCEQGEE